MSFAGPGYRPCEGRRGIPPQQFWPRRVVLPVWRSCCWRGQWVASSGVTTMQPSCELTHLRFADADPVAAKGRAGRPHQKFVEGNYEYRSDTQHL